MNNLLDKAEQAAAIFGLGEHVRDAGERLLVQRQGVNEWDIVLSVGGALVGLIAMLTGQVWIAIVIKFVLFYLFFAPFTPFILILGIVYFICWAIEQFGWVEKNPIDELWEEDVGPWLDEVFEMEYVKIPLQWVEYQVVITMGTLGFDYQSEEYLWMYYALTIPWIWLLVYLILDPFLVAIVPIIAIIASTDISLFAKPHEIWVEDTNDGVKDRAKMNDIEAAFQGLTAGPEEDLVQRTVPRYRKTILVAKGGLGVLLGRIYQLQELMLGDFEFLLNEQYLELNQDRIMGVFFIPYLVPIYQLIYLPFVIIWALGTLLWLLGQTIAVAIHEASNDNPYMSFDTYLQQMRMTAEYTRRNNDTGGVGPGGEEPNPENDPFGDPFADLPSSQTFDFGFDEVERVETKSPEG